MSTHRLGGLFAAVVGAAGKAKQGSRCSGGCRGTVQSSIRALAVRGVMGVCAIVLLRCRHYCMTTALLHMLCFHDFVFILDLGGWSLSLHCQPETDELDVHDRPALY